MKKKTHDFEQRAVRLRTTPDEGNDQDKTTPTLDSKHDQFTTTTNATLRTKKNETICKMGKRKEQVFVDYFSLIVRTTQQVSHQVGSVRVSRSSRVS